MKKVSKILQWVIAILMLIISFGGFMSGDNILATIIFLIGIFISPPIIKLIFGKKDKVECPYCETELEKPPKRKKKCPNCKQPIYPRANPYTKEQLYLTEEGKEEIEKIEERYRIEEGFFQNFEQYGLTKKYFEKRRKDYEKKASSINQEYNVFAFLISLFNELSRNYMDKNDSNKFFDLKMMYFSMARLLYNNNQDYFRFLKESAKMDLYHYKQMEKKGDKKMQVLIQAITNGNNPSCNKCLEQKGKQYTIDEALDKMPIPLEDCENGFCQCLYSAEFVR